MLELAAWAAAAFGLATLVGNLTATRASTVRAALGECRTVLALLANFAIAMSLCEAGVPFNFWLWVTIDIAAMLAIFHEDMAWEDIAIECLFPVAWLCYVIGGEVRPWGTTLVVVAQFLLLSPHSEMLAAVRAVLGKVRPPGRADLMAAPYVA